MNKRQADALQYLMAQKVPLSEIMRNQQQGFTFESQARYHKELHKVNG